MPTLVKYDVSMMRSLLPIGLLKGRQDTFKIPGPEIEVGKAKVKELWPCHVPNFEELDFKVGHFFYFSI